MQPANYVARYRGGGGEFNVETGESMGGSLLSDSNSNLNDDDDDDDKDQEDDDDDDVSEREICLAAYDKKSIAIGGDAETLPCGVAVSDVIVKESNSNKNQSTSSSQTFHWTLSNWGSTQTHRRNDSGTVRVDLASPEDISLDTDNSSRVVFSSYGTNV